MTTLDDVRAGRVSLAGYVSGAPSFARRDQRTAAWFYSPAPGAADPVIGLYLAHPATIIHRVQRDLRSYRTAGSTQTDGKIGGSTLTAMARLVEQMGEPAEAANLRAGRITLRGWELVLAGTIHRAEKGSVALYPGTLLPPVCQGARCTDLGPDRRTGIVVRYGGEGRQVTFDLGTDAPVTGPPAPAAPTTTEPPPPQPPVTPEPPPDMTLGVRGGAVPTGAIVGIGLFGLMAAMGVGYVVWSERKAARRQVTHDAR